MKRKTYTEFEADYLTHAIEREVPEPLFYLVKLVAEVHFDMWCKLWDLENEAEIKTVTSEELDKLCGVPNEVDKNKIDR
jgi:hypothetical protein